MNSNASTNDDKENEDVQLSNEASESHACIECGNSEGSNCDRDTLHKFMLIV